jgi:hypothetical protein
MELEDQFVGYIDLLGFSDATADASSASRILSMLRELTALRSEFAMESQERSYKITPAISTFSDHIVISYPLDSLASSLSPKAARLFALTSFQGIAATIAAGVLRLGLLIRGGATIGKLFHKEGVVFGEGLIEAYRIESQTSIYPRIVLSQRLVAEAILVKEDNPFARADADGLYYLNYIGLVLVKSAVPGDRWPADAKQWFEGVASIISSKIQQFENLGNASDLHKLAKWKWFAREFGRVLKNNQQMLSDLEISLEGIPWLPNS